MLSQREAPSSSLQRTPSPDRLSSTLRATRAERPKNAQKMQQARLPRRSSSSEVEDLIYAQENKRNGHDDAVVPPESAGKGRGNELLREGSEEMRSNPLSQIPDVENTSKGFHERDYSLSNSNFGDFIQDFSPLEGIDEWKNDFPEDPVRKFAGNQEDLRSMPSSDITRNNRFKTIEFNLNVSGPNFTTEELSISDGGKSSNALHPSPRKQSPIDLKSKFGKESIPLNPNSLGDLRKSKIRDMIFSNQSPFDERIANDMYKPKKYLAEMIEEMERTPARKSGNFYY